MPPVNHPADQLTSGVALWGGLPSQPPPPAPPHRHAWRQGCLDTAPAQSQRFGAVASVGWGGAAGGWKGGDFRAKIQFLKVGMFQIFGVLKLFWMVLLSSKSLYAL